METQQQLTALHQWIEKGVNKKYFTRLMEKAKTDPAFAQEQISTFLKTGAELDPFIRMDLDVEYTMTEQELCTPLIDRLNDAVTLAKNYISAHPEKRNIMLKELVAYVDDTYAEEGFVHPLGIDADTCEYVVNNIKFAVSNGEKIASGQLKTDLNPIRSGTVWLDHDGSRISAGGGQILKSGDTYYWYGEDNKLAYTLKTGVACYSSKNLTDWTYEGLAFEAFNTDLNPDFAAEFISDPIRGTKGRIERPKVIYNEKTGKYVMWMHLEKDGGYMLSCAGVAISDEPTRNFKWLWYGFPVWDKSVTPENEKQTYRDCNLFVDTDGTAYTIYASEDNKTMYAVKLNADYTWIDTEGLTEGVDYVNMDTRTQSSALKNYALPCYTAAQLHTDAGKLVNPDGRWSRAIHHDTGVHVVDAREAPAPIKIGDKYFLLTSGCTGWNANPSRAYVSDSILGAWSYQTESLMTGEGGSDGFRCDTSFGSQSTCVVPLPDGRLLYMGDRWKNGNYDRSTGHTVKRSTYIWLPIEFNGDTMEIKWQEEWRL